MRKMSVLRNLNHYANSPRSYRLGKGKCEVPGQARLQEPKYRPDPGTQLSKMTTLQSVL